MIVTLLVLFALVLAVLSCFPATSRGPMLAIAVVLLAVVEVLRLGLLS